MSIALLRRCLSGSSGWMRLQPAFVLVGRSPGPPCRPPRATPTDAILVRNGELAKCINADRWSPRFAEGIGTAGAGKLLHGAAHTCARPGRNTSRVTFGEIVHGFRVGIRALESCVIWEMSEGAFHASHDARPGSFSHANRIHLETARPLTTVAPAEFADDSQPASRPSPSRSRALTASRSGRKVSPGGQPTDGS